MPTVQGTQRFNGSDTFNTVWGTPTQVSSPVYQNEPGSLEIDATLAGSIEGVRQRYSPVGQRPWMGFAFRWSSGTPSNDVTVASIGRDGGFQARLAHGATLGVMYFYFTDGAPAVDATIAASQGHWIWIEMIIDGSVNPHKGYWRIMNKDMPELTSFALAAADFDFSQLFTTGGEGPMTYNVSLWKYGLASSNTDWLGEAAVAASLMSASRRG